MTADAADFEPREINPSTPSAARMYHYYLTGEAIFTGDKLFGERMFELCPYLDIWANYNRAFLRRAAKYMVGKGIRQFLDIGSGLPTAGNTHQVVRSISRDSRVVYVDLDVEAVNRAHDMLAGEGVLDTTAIIEADLRYPDSILDHEDVRRLIDFTRPLGLLIVSVWPFVGDTDRPLELMSKLRDSLASGSYVGMTHVSIDEAGDEAKQQVAAVANSYVDTTDPITMRDRSTFAAFFDGLEIVEPGIVYAPDWRPDEPVDTTDPARPCNFAAVGYKP